MKGAVDMNLSRPFNPGCWRCICRHGIAGLGMVAIRGQQPERAAARLCPLSDTERM